MPCLLLTLTPTWWSPQSWAVPWPWTSHRKGFLGIEDALLGCYTINNHLRPPDGRSPLNSMQPTTMSNTATLYLKNGGPSNGLLALNTHCFPVTSQNPAVSSFKPIKGAAQGCWFKIINYFPTFILYLIRNGVFFLKKTKTTEILFCWKVSMIIFHFDNFQAITRVPDLFDIWSRLKTWLIANVLSSLSSSYSSLPSSSHHNMESFG